MKKMFILLYVCIETKPNKTNTNIDIGINSNELYRLTDRL